MKTNVNELLLELERLCYVESRSGPNGREWRLTEKGRREFDSLGAALAPGAGPQAAAAEAARPRAN